MDFSQRAHSHWLKGIILKIQHFSCMPWVTHHPRPEKHRGQCYFMLSSTRRLTSCVQVNIRACRLSWERRHDAPRGCKSEICVCKVLRLTLNPSVTGTIRDTNPRRFWSYQFLLPFGRVARSSGLHERTVSNIRQLYRE